MPGHGNRPRTPLRACEICGTMFKLRTFKSARKTCSRKCYRIWRKANSRLRQISISHLPKNVAGENNPNYKGPKLVTFTCQVCGNLFQRDLRKCADRVYKTCSKECLSRLKSQNALGENNPTWKGGLEKLICQYCQAEFEAPPSTNRKFCSLDCRDKYWQEYPSEAPNWQGGISKEPYPFEFGKDLKQQIHYRDGFTCQLCDLNLEGQKQKYNRNFSTHHIDYDKDNLDPKNLISLCDSCHSKTHYNRPYWQALLETKIKAIYSEIEVPSLTPEQLILF